MEIESELRVTSGRQLSTLEQHLGEKAQIVRRAGETLAPIEDPKTGRELSVILAHWREAERRLQLAEPDSAEYATAAADVARLRGEYHTAYSAGIREP